MHATCVIDYPSTMTAATANVALIQLRPATLDRDANVKHMRDMVLTAVTTGKENGKPLHMVILPVGFLLLCPSPASRPLIE
jgi:predicted amidohydrolase